MHQRISGLVETLLAPSPHMTALQESQAAASPLPSWTSSTTAAHRLRMYAVQAVPSQNTAGSAHAAYDDRAAQNVMSRVPIAALLGPDEPLRVEKFTENDRTYYRVQNEMYMFPADDEEFERLDIMHLMIYNTALTKRLHVAQFRTPGGPQRILDVGFGTGYWMTEMATQYPCAEIIGIDLDNPTPGIPSPGRCSFLAPVDFVRQPWPVESASTDLVHMAQLLGTVPDWQHMYNKAYRCLRPGTGQIEHIEVDWMPRTSQQAYPQEAVDMYNWWAWMIQASETNNKSLAYRDDTEEMLEAAGFVDVTHIRVRVPLYTQNCKDRNQWSLAHNYQMAMGYIGSKSFTGFSMALFTHVLRLSRWQVEDICGKVLTIVNKKDLPLHIHIHVWTARRPMS